MRNFFKYLIFLCFLYTQGIFVSSLKFPNYPGAICETFSSTSQLYIRQEQRIQAKSAKKRTHKSYGMRGKYYI